jgi:hypothetical protein
MRRLTRSFLLAVWLVTAIVRTHEGKIRSSEHDLAQKVERMEPDALQTAYDQVSHVIQLFLDWRHKVMAFTFTATGGLLALAAWMYDHDLRWTIAIPLIVGALLAFASFVFDKRNHQILMASYALADAFEHKLGLPRRKGPFGAIPRPPVRWKNLFTYHVVLRVAYCLLCGGLIVLAIFVIKEPPVPGCHRLPHPTC